MTLKTCPFCGSEAIFQTTDVERSGLGALISFTLSCSECGARTRDCNGHISISINVDGGLDIWKDQQDMAVIAWNRRVKEELT